MSRIDVSIILVSYNTCEYTVQCIKSIYEKTADVNFDIWVVDNNSQDNTCDKIQQEFPDVNIIKNKKNLGFGKANNIAIQQCCAKYIFLLNTDTVLINNAVKIFYDFLEQNSDIAVAGGNLYDKDNNHVHSYGYFPTLKSEFLKIFKKFDKGNNEKSEQKEVDLIIGADMFIRKSVLDKTGLFDEDFFLYMEETELQYRIKKTGFKTVILPEAQIYHLEGKSSKSRLETRLYKIKSNILFFKKSYGGNLFGIKLLTTFSNIGRLFIHPKIISKALVQMWKI